MVGLLLLVFLVVPIIEIFVIIQVGGVIGVWPTLALLVGLSVVGAWLVKREGVGVWRRAQAQLDAGSLPAGELVDGVLVLGAGALLLTPGFVTDLLGLLLLVPVSRRVVRSLLVGRYERRLRAATGFAGRGARYAYARVYDVRDVRDVGDVTPPEWRGTTPPRELEDG